MEVTFVVGIEVKFVDKIGRNPSPLNIPGSARDRSREPISQGYKPTILGRFKASVRLIPGRIYEQNVQISLVVHYLLISFHEARVLVVTLG